MNRVIKIDLSFIKTIPLGRAIFVMPLPDRLDCDYKEKDYLKAERMESYRSKRNQ